MPHKHDIRTGEALTARLRYQIIGIVLVAAVLTLVSGLFIFRLWELAGINRAQAQAGSTLAQQVIQACKSDTIPSDLRIICDSAYKLITDPQEAMPRGIKTVECLTDGAWRVEYTDGTRERVAGTCNGTTGPVGPPGAPGSVVVMTVTKTVTPNE